MIIKIVKTLEGFVVYQFDNDGIGTKAIEIKKNFSSCKVSRGMFFLKVIRKAEKLFNTTPIEMRL